MRAGDDAVSRTPATTFSVFRLKRDIFRRSSVGVLFTERSKSSVGAGSGGSVGVDAALRLQELVTVNAYLAKTRTPGLTRDEMSHRTQFSYQR